MMNQNRAHDKNIEQHNKMYLANKVRKTGKPESSHLRTGGKMNVVGLSPEDLVPSEGSGVPGTFHSVVRTRLTFSSSEEPPE